MKQPISHILFSFLLAALFTQAAFSQSVRIVGQVVEMPSEEPIPFANVFTKNFAVGVTADEFGRYELVADAAQLDSLGASAVGYRRVFRQPNKDSLQTINFRLERDENLPNEVVILPGENPAHRFVREIIAHKDERDIDQSDQYTYEVYNKMELDITEINKRMFEKNKLLKPFAFILDNVDSTSEDRPFLPLFLTESLSDYYFRNEPRATKEVIKASNVSGVNNESVSQFLGSMYDKLDIYENFMPVVGKNIPSPIGDQAFTFYKFYLLDSATIGNHWCYKIKFRPKFPQDNAFYGDFWVADTVFAVKQISMELTGEASNINFVQQLNLFQSFSNVRDQVWAMDKSKLIVDFALDKRTPAIIGRKTTTYRNFQFEESAQGDVWRNKEDIEVSEDVMKKDQNFWNTVRPDTLSKNERAIYAMMDTLDKMPLAQTYVRVLEVIGSGYFNVGNVKVVRITAS